MSEKPKVCPSCTWRGEVELLNGVCPQCSVNWESLHYQSELTSLTQRLEAAEAEREYYKNNASAWKEFAEHMEYCAVCAEDVDNCEDGSILQSVAKVKIDDVILKGDA